MERDIIAKLLSQYKNAVFNNEHVEALLNGEKLPVTASPTLLDIEQSINPAKEQHPSINAPRAGSDNVE